MTGKIDLNADAGEGYGRWSLGDEEGLVPWVTSVSLACGFHAGDPLTISRSLAVAARHGTGVGAHPGYPDLLGFGRRHLSTDPEELRAQLIYQVGALAALARAAGLVLEHVKAHGALYHDTSCDRTLAGVLVEAVKIVCPEAILVCPPGSELVALARRAGLAVAAEGFADRAYLPDGRLVPRSLPGAVLGDRERVTRQAVQLACEGRVTAVDGTELELDVQTICVHGDTPGAAELARAVRQGLERSGVLVVRLKEVLG